ncbi:hypothetical protein ASG23_06760 [Cellulomonas sp. Leaf395]|nr:hypothetical protein ASG23_06760 [Cellulomonas sp. Leaf395]
MAHVARVLASTLDKRIPGFADARREGRRNIHIVSEKVLLSHESLRLSGGEWLPDGAVVRLFDAPHELIAADAELPEVLAPMRENVLAYLLGLSKREGIPSQIGPYKILQSMGRAGIATTYAARHEGGNELVVLRCSPTTGWADPDSARRAILREYDALRRLADSGRVWRVDPYFTWNDDTIVVPIIPAPTSSLTMSIRKALPARTPDGRVAEAAAEALVSDAFAALAEVHATGLLHRGLHPDRVEFTTDYRVRFRDFFLARIVEGQTIAPALAEPSPDLGAPFRAPECRESIATAMEASDTYSLALALSCWLLGEASREPDHDGIRARIAGYPTLGPVLAECLDPDALRRPSPSQAAQRTAPERPAPRNIVGTMQNVEPDERYTTVRQLGEGATAISLLVHDKELDRHFCLKQFKEGVLSAEDIRREFDAQDALVNARCARVYQYWPNPKPGRLLVEYIDGRDLADYGREPNHTMQDFRTVAIDVLDGLAAAHDLALLHRDLSPSNILVKRDNDRGVLIDFGLVTPNAMARTRVGTPAYTAPEVDQSGRWSYTADIYSLGVSLIRSILGRLPYQVSAGGQLNKRVIVPPTPDEADAWGRPFLDVLFNAVHYDASERPGSARSMRDDLTRVVAEVSEPSGEAKINPTVDMVRSLYRASTIGNAGNRGLDDAFARETYASTQLDSALLPAVVAGALDLVVLTGNPGDGKTSFLAQVGDALDRAGAETLETDAAGWRKRQDGRTYAAVYDASESHGSLSADGLLRRALDIGEGDDPALRTILIAANDGRLMQFFEDNQDLYGEVWAELRRQRDGRPPKNPRIGIVDLKRRSLASPQMAQPDGLGGRILELLVGQDRWSACEGCASYTVCPMRSNAEALREQPAREAVNELVLISHLRRRRRATVRDVRSALAWLITGDRSCQDVHVEREAGLDPREGNGRVLHDLAFDMAADDYLVREWTEIDPAIVAAPSVEREARTRQDLVPDLGLFDGKAVAELQRRLFFGGWSTPDVTRSDVRTYRYLAEYSSALRDADEQSLGHLLLGLSRVLGMPGYVGTGLAVRDRAFDERISTGSAVVKELPANEFELRPIGSEIPYVESFPDALQLKHTSGSALAITLDTAELLFRVADGEILGDSASAGVQQEIFGFGNDLLLSPSTAVRIVDTTGRSTRVVRDGARIVRESK